MAKAALGQAEAHQFGRLLSEAAAGERPDVYQILLDHDFVDMRQGFTQKALVENVPGLSRARLSQYEDDALPTNGRSRREKRYPGWGLLAWYNKRINKIGRPTTEGGTEYAHERTRLTAAKADLAEIEREELRQETVRRELADAQKLALVLEIKTNLLGRVPKLVAGIRNRKWKSAPLRTLLVREFQRLLGRMEQGRVEVPGPIGDDYVSLMRRIIPEYGEVEK